MKKTFIILSICLTLNLYTKCADVENKKATSNRKGSRIEQMKHEDKLPTYATIRALPLAASAGRVSPLTIESKRNLLNQTIEQIKHEEQLPTFGIFTALHIAADSAERVSPLTTEFSNN